MIVRAIHILSNDGNEFIVTECDNQILSTEVRHQRPFNFDIISFFPRSESWSDKFTNYVEDGDILTELWSIEL